MVAALQVLFAVVSQGKPVHELKQGMRKYPQVMINVPAPNKDVLDGDPAIAEAVSGIESRLAGAGRVLLRPSGTEPLVRVMVEGEDPKIVESLKEDLAQRVADALA